MRAISPWLAALLALALVLSTLAPAVPTAGPAAALAGDDDGGEGHDDDGGNGNEGEGKKDKDKDKGKDDDNRGRGNADDADAVTAAAGYTMDVSCLANREAASTACTFTPRSPPGGKEVNHVVIPESLVCTDVRDGDATYVESDPHAHVAGYRFEGQGSFQMTFVGTVEPGAEATYWVKAASEVYPATGPGLACLGIQSDALPASTPELAATPPPDTGTIVVASYACRDLPADTAGVDWFGECTPDGAGHRYLLDPVDAATSELFAAESTDTGEATFSDLPAGTYNLDDPDDDWCHAESDNVNVESSVVVEGGATTTVWLFYCEEEVARS